MAENSFAFQPYDNALKKGLEKEEILPVNYDLLTDMMKVVTEGLTKNYRKTKKKLDEIMDNHIYTTHQIKFIVREEEMERMKVLMQTELMSATRR